VALFEGDSSSSLLSIAASSASYLAFGESGSGDPSDDMGVEAREEVAIAKAMLLYGLYTVTNRLGIK
jgi:hypothetical protein